MDDIPQFWRHPSCFPVSRYNLILLFMMVDFVNSSHCLEGAKFFFLVFQEKDIKLVTQSILQVKNILPSLCLQDYSIVTTFSIYHLHLHSGAISLQSYLQSLVSSIYLKSPTLQSPLTT